MSKDILDILNVEYIIFREEWLDIEDYELKILMLVGLLAENNFGYRGNLKTMCDWLCVQSCTKNNSKIKEAIEGLSSKELIFAEKEGRTYHLSIRAKGLKDKRIVKVRKIWVETIRKYNRDDNNKKIDDSISVDWIKILKVFIFFYGNSNCIHKQKEIAKELNMSLDTVRKSINAIMQSEFDGLNISKRVVKDKYVEDGMMKYNTKGTEMDFILMFEEK